MRKITWCTCRIFFSEKDITLNLKYMFCFNQIYFSSIRISLILSMFVYLVWLTNFSDVACFVFNFMRICRERLRCHWCGSIGWHRACILWILSQLFVSFFAPWPRGDCPREVGWGGDGDTCLVGAPHSVPRTALKMISTSESSRL
jgi:hypothetical protein